MASRPQITNDKKETEKMELVVRPGVETGAFFCKNLRFLIFRSSLLFRGFGEAEFVLTKVFYLPLVLNFHFLGSGFELVFLLAVLHPNGRVGEDQVTNPTLEKVRTT